MPEKGPLLAILITALGTKGVTVTVGISDDWVDGVTVSKTPVADGVGSTSIVAGVVVQAMNASIIAISSNGFADL